MPRFTRIECQPPVKEKKRKTTKNKTNIAGFILPIIVSLISLCLEDVDC